MLTENAKKPWALIGTDDDKRAFDISGTNLMGCMLSAVTFPSRKIDGLSDQTIQAKNLRLPK